jgi:hypothetical protein
VIAPVPRQEGHLAARHLADEDRLTRLAEGGLNLHLFGVGEELVEARTSDDPDVGDRSHGRQATFSPDELEEPEDEPAEELTDEDAAFSPPDVDEDEDPSEDDAVDVDEVEADAGVEAADPLLLSVR